MDEIKYYLWASYHRKILDKLLEKKKKYFQGIVLDIGGRDRGKFNKPKKSVIKWIFADIVPENKPDIVLDVENMHSIKNNSINTICAIELFEHVKNPERGIKECFRILKNEGHFIVSAPFMYYIHADPHDYQRWTNEKWKIELNKVGFSIHSIKQIGLFFTVFSDMIKTLNKSLPRLLRYFGYIFYPLLTLIIKFDNLKIIKKNRILNKFTTGYFIIAKK